MDGAHETININVQEKPLTVQEETSEEDMTLPEGMEWRGDNATFVGNYCDGNGKLIWKNGDQYIGALNEGIRHGIGICRRFNGEKYEG